MTSAVSIDSASTGAGDLMASIVWTPGAMVFAKSRAAGSRRLVTSSDFGDGSSVFESLVCSSAASDTASGAAPATASDLGACCAGAACAVGLA